MSTIRRDGRVGFMEMARRRPDKREEAPSPIHDVKRAFLDIERGLSHSLA